MGFRGISNPQVGQFSCCQLIDRQSVANSRSSLFPGWNRAETPLQLLSEGRLSRSSSFGDCGARGGEDRVEISLEKSHRTIMHRRLRDYEVHLEDVDLIVVPGSGGERHHGVDARRKETLLPS